MVTDLEPIDIQTFSREDAEALWARIKEQELAFDDYNRGRGDLFAARLCAINSMAFQLPEGLALAENIVPKLSAELHFFLWPKVSEQRAVERGRDVVRYLFERVPVHRVNAWIPVYHKVAQRIALRVGFKFEGAIREQAKVNGSYHDVNVYGILEQEFRRMNWRLNGGA